MDAALGYYKQGAWTCLVSRTFFSNFALQCESRSPFKPDHKHSIRNMCAGKRYLTHQVPAEICDLAQYGAFRSLRGGQSGENGPNFGIPAGTVRAL